MPLVHSIGIIVWLACVFGLVLLFCPKPQPEPLFRSLFTRQYRLAKWLELRLKADYAVAHGPPPPPPPPPSAEPVDMYDDEGVLHPEHNGSGLGTNPAYDDAKEGYTAQRDQFAAPAPPVVQPPKPKVNFWAAFSPIARAEPQPELTEAEARSLDEKYALLGSERKAREQLLSSVTERWNLTCTRTGLFGRKSRDILFTEALLALVTRLIRDGATSDAFSGARPKRPEDWSPGDAIRLHPPLQQPAPAGDGNAGQDDNAGDAVQAKSQPKQGKKRGPYKHRTDEIKYLFWDIHRDYKHTSVRQTVEFVNANLSTTFQGPLSIDTVIGKTGKKGWTEFKARPVPVAAAEPQKRGPKKRKLPAGEFTPWNNRRVPISVLLTLSSMIMALVRAGVPIVSGTVLCLALGLFSTKAITWIPAKSWPNRFLHRLGLKVRRGTRAARALPADFATVQHLFLLRVVFVVMTFGILRMFFFNLDETGVRFMPMKDRTWAPEGAAQVDISNMGDKRLFTCVPVVDATGNLVYTQVIWQGKTDASCPKADIQAQHKDVLAHTRSTTHWSTPTTMELLVDNLWNGYVKPKMIELGLDLMQTRWCITWDVYTSHRDHGLLARLQTKYPTLLILFIPASCTSALQPLDIGFNFDFKAIITALACAWLSLQVSTQLENGTEPEAVTVPHKKTELVEPFCSWLAAACRKMKTPEKKSGTVRAWEKSGMTIAWEHGSQRRQELFEEAKKLDAGGTLFVTHSDRRSKAGKVPRTLMTVAGMISMQNVAGVDDADERGNDEDPVDCDMFESVGHPEAEGEAKAGRGHR